MRQFLVFAVVVLLLAAPGAGAKDSQTVFGTYTQGLVPGVPFTADQISKNVCIITLGLRLYMSGDLNGTFDALGTLNLKGSCMDPFAPGNFHAKGEFNGTLKGDFGGFDGNMVVRHEQGGTTHGQIVIQHARGDLAGLHGILHSEGVAGPGGGGTYTGEVHFAP